MGEHTKFLMECKLNQNTPKQVIEILEFMTQPDYLFLDEIPFETLPDHPFFETDVWEAVLFTGGGALWNPNSTLEWSEASHTYRLNVRSSVKDQDEQVPLFLHWLAPYIGTKGFVGLIHPEYEALPSRILIEGDQAYLVEPVANRAGLTHIDHDQRLAEMLHTMKVSMTEERWNETRENIAKQKTFIETEISQSEVVEHLGKLLKELDEVVPNDEDRLY